ncbi:hypothetical protein PMAYCL1PPCAC_27529, partial [Pristionchus mayeri]
FHSQESIGTLEFPRQMGSPLSLICDIVIDPPKNESTHLGVFLKSLVFPNSSIIARHCANATNYITLFDGVTDRSHSHQVVCGTENKIREFPMNSG